MVRVKEEMNWDLYFYLLGIGLGVTLSIASFIFAEILIGGI